MNGVALDPAVRVQIDAIIAWMNGGPDCFLELYTNDIDITPAKTSPALYVRPNYAGYVALDLLGTFGAATAVQFGEWFTQSGPWTFGTNADSYTETVYGWTLRRASKIVYGEPFSGPVNIAPGQPGPSIFPRLTAGAQSILCPDA